ncbi:MAG: helix-turn-helix transcriptional regulator [Saprospiraceae bacterium]|nr:helix-turn-helix transcriptional regulator [Saprospiraceae bacterium]
MDHDSFWVVMDENGMPYIRDGLSPRQSEASITPRGIEILDLLVQGYHSRRIVEQLYISSETLRMHRKNILNKAEVHSTPELVAFVLSNGIA